MNELALAWKFLMRDYRAGELRILCIALIVAVTGTTTVTLFADRLQQTMTRQAAEFLAADLVINGSTPTVESWRQQAEALGLQQANAVEFSSVLLENGQMLLASVKAVDPAYPLRGHLKIRPSLDASDSVVKQGPPPDSVWVEARILSALQLKVGDRLTVGEKALTISQLLSYEPDKRGDLYSLSPRVMMNSADLAAANVIQPGSHVHYLYQLAGSTAAILQFKRDLNPKLNPSQKLLDIHQDRPEVGGALERAERYLSLSSIMVVLIAGVAIAMSTRRYSERHFDACAILRCLGCSRKTIISLYLYQILLLGSVASTIGCLLGLGLQQLLFNTLASLLPPQVVAPSLLALSLGFASGLVILLGFALPPIIRLQQVSALRVLRRDLEPVPTQGWLLYGSALLLVSALIWQHTHDVKMTLTLIAGSVVLLLLIGFAINGLFRLLHTALPYLPLIWRLSLQSILQNRGSNIAQILAFSITFMAMLLSFSVKNDLLKDWQQQLPSNAPNHFALNIFANQLTSFQDDLKQNSNSTSHFYPVVSGRLIQINGEKVQQHVTKDSQGERAIERDLSLTWSLAPPVDNNLSAGKWWSADTPGLVSVEQKLAENLHIQLDDTLTFSVGSEQFNAKVTSLRQVHWETMQPNFYMIFSPSSLQQYAHTYLTSFFLPAQQKDQLNSMVKKYPNLTILEVDAILKQFQTILTQLTRAIDYLFALALLAGFSVLFAALFASLDQRLYRGAIMRTLGASSQLLRRTHLLEFALLGGLAGITASLLTLSLSYALYRYVLHLPFHPNLWLYLSVPLAAGLLISLLGYLGLRDIVNKSPLQVLQTV